MGHLLPRPRAYVPVTALALIQKLAAFAFPQHPIPSLYACAYADAYVYVYVCLSSIVCCHVSVLVLVAVNNIGEPGAKALAAALAASPSLTRLNLGSTSCPVRFMFAVSFSHHPQPLATRT